MATVKEANLQGKDAAASVDTMAVMAVGDMFQGTLGYAYDEDWVKIELKAGMTYSITLSGRKSTTAGTEAEDPILMLLDSKGGMIAMSDDINPVGNDRNTDTGDDTNLNSALRFKAEEDGTYYISASSYTGNPESDTSGDYTISVKEEQVPADIEGSAVADKIVGTDRGESIMGGGGNDTIDGKGGNDELDGGDGDDLLTGGAGGDVLKGGDGDDTISYMMSPAGVSVNLNSGTASGGDADGDDLGEDIENVIGSMYDDDLRGARRGERDNKLWGEGGDDNLSGDRGNDELYGGAGDDMLDGGDNDDELTGGPGMDTLTGGDGKDTASWAGSMMGVTVRLHTGQVMGGDAEGDMWGEMVTVPYTVKDEDGKDVEKEETVPDIENLTGSGHDDILAGDSRANTIMGGAGDDKLYGGPGGGNDELDGGGGKDHLFGGLGNDMLDGGGGDDTLQGGKGADTVYGGFGTDFIYADGDDTIDGFVKDQVPDDGDTSTTDDVGIQYNGETVTEADDDKFSADTVSYERLKDGVTAELGTGITNVENLIGTNENDNLTGDAKNNEIDGRDGADELKGEGGTDTVSYAMSDRGVTINLTLTDGEQPASGGHAQGDKLTGFENATGSAHSDVLTGDTTANTLKGLAGDDELIGGTGGDTIEGGAGADELDGGTNADDLAGQNLSTYGTDGSVTTAGDNGADRDGDTLSYSSSDAAVTVNLATLTFSGGHAEGDEIEVERDAFDPDGNGDGDPIDVSTFENVTGSDHNDRLTGDHRDNELKGGKGDDTLRGGASSTVDDNIDTRADNIGDILIGGPGADMLDGGEDPKEKDNMVPGTGDTTVAASMDVASYAGSKMGVTVNLDSGRGTAGDAEGDTLVNIEKVVGSSNDDVFIASSGKDNIDGSTNTGVTDDGIGDTVSYELSEAGVIVDLTVATAQTDTTDTAEDSYAVGDILAGIENVTGSLDNDTLKGDANPNRLMGGDGNDTLEGGSAGNDTLMGGAGKDTLKGGDETVDSTLTTREGDTLEGGAGDDILEGGSGDDRLNGGAGNDELNGDPNNGTDNDTFIFSPADGNAHDIINDFDTARDAIDLSAFDLDADDLMAPGVISTRGTGDNVRVQIDLRSFGGGTIELANVDDLDNLEVAGGATEDKIDTLSVWNDDDGDQDTTDGDGNTFVDDGEGIFIL